MKETRIRSAIVYSADKRLGEALAAAIESLPRESEQTDLAQLAVIAPGDISGTRPFQLTALRTTLGVVLAQSLDRLILISSGAIYGPDHRLNGFVLEDLKRRPSLINQQAEWWEEVEAVVRQETVKSGVDMLVIRCPFVIGGDGTSIIDRIVKRRFLIRYAGFNPPLQFVSVSGLARAVAGAVKMRLSGVYHIAPDDVVPLRTMLRAMGVRSIGMPRVLQRILRPMLLRFLDGIETTDEVDYMRYSWTLSGKRFSSETDLSLSSKGALEEVCGQEFEKWPEFDQFGANESFISQQGESTFRFMEKVFWRIECRGTRFIPKEDGAIVVGPHRGFMPLDAVMVVHLIYRYAGRFIRFISHPTLSKFPFQGTFFQRIGALPACQENAERVLRSGGVLGVYPEGIRGTFKMYREAYVFGRFGRPDYARWALEFNVPVIPFAAVGCAEIFPILGKLKLKRLRAYLEWPFIPITPTFPVLPVPLPSKWHIEFLPPVYPEEVRRIAAESGQDPVKVFTTMVLDTIEKSTREMLAKRRTVFRGKLWT